MRVKGYVRKGRGGKRVRVKPYIRRSRSRVSIGHRGGRRMSSRAFR